eukprot:TRINITY_DN88349_c0_g1_i1.p2 TRINITY_DN88349_c0_g1~~TRINITY_DN88349_c0_g1_i1.p2  ORF type:complete len:139 (-),score=13.44 TRINITY_DN88349_c0_g1_i1:180-596(-)
MAYSLQRLHSAFAVEQALNAEQQKLVLIRFGRDWDSRCMEQDETLAAIQDTVKTGCVIYLVDIDEVPDFNQTYELANDACTLMFFYVNKYMAIDLGNGTHNKINWPVNKQDLINITETVYRGAQKGRDTVVGGQSYGH